jgi:hypothetical protein
VVENDKSAERCMRRTKRCKLDKPSTKAISRFARFPHVGSTTFRTRFELSRPRQFTLQSLNFYCFGGSDGIWASIPNAKSRQARYGLWQAFLKLAKL